MNIVSGDPAFQGPFIPSYELFGKYSPSINAARSKQQNCQKIMKFSILYPFYKLILGKSELLCSCLVWDKETLKQPRQQIAMEYSLSCPICSKS